MGAPGRAPFYLEQSLFTTEDTGDTEEDFCEFHLTLICFVVWAICEYRGGMAFSRPKRRQYSEDELYEYAVGALGRRMRTVAELKRLMRARVEEPESEYGQTLGELVIRRLKDQGYLNDSQYAAYYSSLRRDNQKLGRMRVVTELKTRGVHGSVIEKAVEAAYEGVADEKQAREYLRKKRLQKPKDQKETARVFRQLARAGFGMKTIFTILKKWDVDDEILSTLESETA
jgi:regulatory protein